MGTVPNLVTETAVSFIRLSAKCGSKPSTCQNAARSGGIVLAVDGADHPEWRHRGRSFCKVWVIMAKVSDPDGLLALPHPSWPRWPSSDPLWIPLLPNSSHSDPLWVVLGTSIGTPVHQRAIPAEDRH